MLEGESIQVCDIKALREIKKYDMASNSSVATDDIGSYAHGLRNPVPAATVKRKVDLAAL